MTFDGFSGKPGYTEGKEGKTVIPTPIVAQVSNVLSKDKKPSALDEFIMMPKEEREKINAPMSQVVDALSDRTPEEMFLDAVAENRKSVEGLVKSRWKEAWRELKEMMEQDWGPDTDGMFDVAISMMEELEKKYELTPINPKLLDALFSKDDED